MRNIYKLVKPFFLGDDKIYARSMGFFLIILSLSKVYCGYLFTQWNRLFYDALENKNLSDFIQQSIYFAVLASAFVFLYSLTRYLIQRYTLRWRIWVTQRALNFWLIQNNKSLEGADQRIQEDIMLFTDLVERHFLELFNNIVILICFAPLLFIYTKNLVLFDFHIPGLLFYVAILYTVIGFWVSQRIGRSLIKLEYNSQKVEANMRYHLVHAKDGKPYEANQFKGFMDAIVNNHISIYRCQKRFTLWQKCYDQYSFLIPFIFVGPSYFAGVFSLGALFQIKSIFSRIRNAMAYILTHFIEFTELLATADRLTEFFDHLEGYDSEFNAIALSSPSASSSV